MISLLLISAALAWICIYKYLCKRQSRSSRKLPTAAELRNATYLALSGPQNSAKQIKWFDMIMKTHHQFCFVYVMCARLYSLLPNPFGCRSWSINSAIIIIHIVVGVRKHRVLCFSKAGRQCQSMQRCQISREPHKYI